MPDSNIEEVIAECHESIQRTKSVAESNAIICAKKLAQDTLILAALEAYQVALSAPRGLGEPVAWMYQHDESTRLTFVEVSQSKGQWEKDNPRWGFVCAVGRIE